MCYHTPIPWVPDFRLQGALHTPSTLPRSNAGNDLRFLLFTENSETEFSTAFHPQLTRGHSCRLTWRFPPLFLFLRAKKPRRHAERGTARKNSMTKKPIFRKPLAKSVKI